MYFLHWSSNLSYGLHFFLVLARIALLVIGWRGGFSSLNFPSMTGTVGFCLVGIFRSVTTFVDLFHNFYESKNLTCILVGPSLKILSLQIGLFRPRAGDGVK